MMPPWASPNAFALFEKEKELEAYREVVRQYVG
jgi:hypothetical protein